MTREDPARRQRQNARFPPRGARPRKRSSSLFGVAVAVFLLAVAGVAVKYVLDSRRDTDVASKRTAVGRPRKKRAPVPPAPSVATTEARPDEPVQSPPETPSVVHAAPAPKFDLDAWKARYGKKVVPEKGFQRLYPLPYRGYFPKKDVKAAREWRVELGPLGITTLMHDRTWESYPAFKALFPAAMLGKEGQLLANAFEVVAIDRDGPSAGLMQVGDLIFEIDGESVKSAEETFPDKEVLAKNMRGLETHAGQLLDLAEGRGVARLRVLRLGKRRIKTSPPADPWTLLASKEMKTREQKAAPFSFEVPLKDAREFRLVATDGGNGRHSDHLYLEGVLLVRGDRKMLLHELNNSVSNNGYGRVQVDREANSWHVHAPCRFDFVVPDGGEWTLKGSIRAGSGATIVGRVETHGKPPEFPLPELVQYTKNVDIEIPRIGSFAGRYDPDCEKAETYRAMLAHRLAVQQDEDGKWPGGGYARHSFCTAMCGLGLLAHADPAYDANIRRAAYYVAYAADPTIWAYPRGLILQFVCEYYLRTGDDDILPAMHRLYLLSRQNVLADGTAGHKLHPGYDGPGYIGGGAVICCALAAARHTPLNADGSVEKLLRKMLLRVQDLAPTGFVPYGRDNQQNINFAGIDVDGIKGQATSCASGPYAVATLTAGGPEHFTKVTRKRYGSGPFGNVDAGHATAVIPFVMGSLAVNACGDEALREHLGVFLWKLTTHRKFNGFINGNTNRLEYRGGDAVLGYPFWRTGGYLLVLNSHKRNLAMTGQPKYTSKQAMASTPSGHQDDAFWRFTLRNWNVAESLLGNKMPVQMRQAIRVLRGMKSGADLDTRMWDFLRGPGIETARAIAGVRGLEAQKRGYLIEMVLGIGVHCVMDSDRRLAARDKKPAKGLKPGEDRIHLWAEAYSPLSQFPKLVPAEWKKSHPVADKLTPTGTITVNDSTRKYLQRPAVFRLEKMTRIRNVLSRRSKERPPRNCPALMAAEKQPFKLQASVDYRVGGLHVTYDRTIDIDPFVRHRRFHNVRKVWVNGKLGRHYENWTLQIRLGTGQLIDLTDQSEGRIGWGVIPAGTPGKFLVSSGDQWEGLAHEMRITDHHHGMLKPQKISCEGDHTVDPECLVDRDPKTVLTVPGKGGAIVYYDFATPTEVRGFMRRGPGNINIRVEVWVDGKWRPFGAPSRNGLYLIPATKSKRFRVEVSAGKVSDLYPLR